MRKSILRLFVCCTIVLSFFVTVSACKKKINGTVVLNFWEMESVEQDMVIDKLAAEFMRINPEISIRRVHYDDEYDLSSKCNSGMTNGDTCDVILGSSRIVSAFLSDYPVSRNLIIPITDIVESNYLDAFDANALRAGTRNTKQYLLPDRQKPELILIYNKDVVENPPKTWEELEAIGKSLVDPKTCEYPLVFCTTEPYWVMPFYGAFGGTDLVSLPGTFPTGIYTPDPNTEGRPRETLNNKPMKETMRFMYRLIEQKIVRATIDYDAANSIFMKGKAPFIINNLFSCGEYAKKGMHIGVCTIPPFNGKFPRPYFEVHGYVVLKAAVEDLNKKEAIRRFVEFMTNRKSQLAMCSVHMQIPSIKSAMTDEQVAGNPFLAGQIEQLSKSDPYPKILNRVWTYEEMKAILANVLSGNIKPEDAPAKMQSAANGVKGL